MASLRQGEGRTRLSADLHVRAEYDRVFTVAAEHSGNVGAGLELPENSIRVLRSRKRIRTSAYLSRTGGHRSAPAKSHNKRERTSSRIKHASQHGTKDGQRCRVDGAVQARRAQPWNCQHTDPGSTALAARFRLRGYGAVVHRHGRTADARRLRRGIDPEPGCDRSPLPYGMDVQRSDRPLHLPSDARGGRADHGLLRGTYLVLGGVLAGTRPSNQRLREYRRGRFSQGTEVSQRIRVSDERQAGGVRRYGPAGVLAAQLLASGRGDTRHDVDWY